MELEPPASQYVTGPKPTHSSRAKLPERITAFKPEEISQLLAKGGFLTEEGKPTRLTLQKGLVDKCEGKALWNVNVVKKALVELSRPAPRPKKDVKPISAPVRTGPAWVDLETIGTYFGVGKIQVGRWLDELGLRELPKIEVNESGDFDMLDMANRAKEKQAAGFIAKKPSEKALAHGFVQITVVTGKKDKTFEVVKWNLDKVKEVFVRAGHELDTERKLMFKGKGKNGDVKVGSIDDRARQLHAQWLKLYKNPKTKKESWDVFRGQPSGIVARVEAIMGAPGFIKNKKFLREDL